MERVHVYVRGRVQGVFFRASTRDQARRLRLHGWVRNCRDGSVEIIAEGGKDNLQQFLGWCRGGPPGATVTDIIAEWQQASGEFVGFTVRY
jgi:acylphosphatase